jgi:hypothetical protein
MKPKTTIFLFGIYVALLGLSLLIIPDTVLSVFRFPSDQGYMVRVLGSVVMVLGFYYIQAARDDSISFFRSSVWGRTMILVLFTALVAAGNAQPQLVLFGMVDALGALWTARALKKSA